MSSPSQRIVLITGDGLEHRYIANRLSQELSLAAMIIDHGRPVGRRARILALLRRYTLPELFGRLCVKALSLGGQTGKRQEQVREILGHTSAEFRETRLLRHVHGINTAEGVEAAIDGRPDILLVFGTGLVGPKVLSLAGRVALNVHTGLSPYYRGAECTFWPLHDGVPEMLGVTVHECTAAVDGGKIFATRRVHLEANDCEGAVFARCIVTAADLYIKVVKEILAGAAIGHPQDLSLGKEYRAKDHGVFAELRVRRLIRNGLIRRYVESQSQASQESLK